MPVPANVSKHLNNKVRTNSLREREVRTLADTLVLPQTQKLYEVQEELTELQAYANMLNTPDVDGKVGEVTDLTAVMRVRYNAGSSTRIHTSEAFNKYFAEFVKANAQELVTRTVQKALEMVNEQKALAAQEVLEQLNITGATQSFNPPAEGAPVFTGSMQAVGYAGEPISQYVNAASLPISAIKFETTDDVPEGISIDPESGLLTGTVMKAGTYGITIKATNDKGTTTKVLSLIIAERTQPNTPAPTAPMIYGQLNVQVVQNKPFVFKCAASNVPQTGVVWSITPDLTTTIPGLAFDTATGQITGTPTAPTGTYNFELRVEVPATGGWDTAQYTITVTPEVADIGTNPLIHPLDDRMLAEGTAFYATAGGLNIGPGSVWTISGQPSGISINSVTGKITGSPAFGTDGTYTVEVKVTLPDSRTATQTFALTVTPVVPVIKAGQSFTATVGTAFSGTVLCSHPSATFSMTGLPGSFTYDSATGTITGTPVSGDTGSHTITVTAMSTGGTSAPESVVLQVNP